ncbi:MAG: 4Fe-4S binding protein [Ruminococcus sp.]|uniref:4Fe-4S binding protein n=1 Tax=Ruminococcus sp. TaxID=41978 RepID=UPI0037C6C434|nr:4Fe-4S binding protein [Ruminococcus sp.]
MCVEVCPQSCIITEDIPYVIMQENCLHCGNCYSVCPAGAITFEQLNTIYQTGR